MVYASGVLPVSRVPASDRDPSSDRVVFLVGKDIRDGTWSDFGGKVERPDRGPTDTAAREFFEESLGVVASQWAVQQRMHPSNCVALPGTTQNGHPYYMYLLEVPYSPHVRQHFLKTRDFLQAKGYVSCIEKTDVAWVDLAGLKAIPKRTVFKATVERHMGTLARIEHESWREFCATTAPDAQAFGSPR